MNDTFNFIKVLLIFCFVVFFFNQIFVVFKKVFFRGCGKFALENTATKRIKCAKHDKLLFRYSSASGVLLKK